MTDHGRRSPAEHPEPAEPARQGPGRAPERTDHDLAGVTIEVPAGAEPPPRRWPELVAAVVVVVVVGLWWWFTSPDRSLDDGGVGDQAIASRLDPSLVPGTRIDVPGPPSESRVHDEAARLADDLATLLDGPATSAAGTAGEPPEPHPRHDLQLALWICGGAVDHGGVTALVAADVVAEDRSGSLAIVVADPSTSRGFVDALADQARACAPARTGNRDDHVAVLEVEDTRYLEVVRNVETAEGAQTWVFLVQSAGDVVVAGHVRGPSDAIAADPPELLARLHGLAAARLEPLVAGGG